MTAKLSMGYINKVYFQFRDKISLRYNLRRRNIRANRTLRASSFRGCRVRASSGILAGKHILLISNPKPISVLIAQPGVDFKHSNKWYSFILPLLEVREGHFVSY